MNPFRYKDAPVSNTLYKVKKKQVINSKPFIPQKVAVDRPWQFFSAFLKFEEGMFPPMSCTSYSKLKRRFL